MCAAVRRRRRAPRVSGFVPRPGLRRQARRCCGWSWRSVRIMRGAQTQRLYTEELAQDAAEILDGRTADVVGLSMGGYVALTLALSRPDLVRSLVLIGTGAGGPDRVPRSEEHTSELQS